MKRFLAMLLVLCFSLVGGNTMAFAAESTGDAQNTETVNNLQSADNTETTATTGSAWEYETPMQYATCFASACSVGDKIYYIGGQQSVANKNTSVVYNQIYNTKTKTWSLGTPLGISCVQPSSTAYKNKIYIMGGLHYTPNGSNPINSLQIYDTETNTWTNGASMIYPTSSSASVLVGNKIYVFGGTIVKDNQAYDSNKVQIYDLDKNEWSLGTDLPFGYRNPKVCTDGKLIYLLSGVTNSKIITGNIRIYDTTSNLLSTIETEMAPLSLYTNTVTIGNKTYIACCDQPAFVSKSVSCFDMSNNSWKTLPDVNSPRSSVCIASVGNKIYVLGGDTSGTTQTPVVESLSIADDTTPQLSVLLNQGESVKLSVSKTSADNSKYTWTSSDEKVATVDANGLVSAINPGKANIYAENADTKFKEYIPVVVVEGVADETRLAVNLDLNQTKQLYLNDDTKNITWSSNDESICTVADGIITAKKNGLAIIKATYNDKTYQMYVRVTNL